MSETAAEPTVLTPATPATTAPDRELPEPTTERAVSLHRRVSAERWRGEVETALWRLQVLKEVERLKRKGHGARLACLRRVAPDVHWSTYCGWRRSVGEREGPEWERLLDGRVPPSKPPILPPIAAAAAALRRANPTLSCTEARSILQKQFGKPGALSDSSLYRIWRKENLTCPKDPERFERVEQYAGGAALVLVGAAAEESGIAVKMAEAALESAKEAAAAQEGGLPSDPHPGRDEKGRFTDAYNHAVREGVEPGQADSRWEPDARKREKRDLSTLSVLGLAPETLARRLLTIGMAPLVGEARGFEPLDGPRAKWLGALGAAPYRPATLAKTLAELALLGVDEALWERHGEVWSQKAKEWAEGGPSWMALIRYLDKTDEPYWTTKFARCGKVSRTGRVQPCLQRIALMGGPGVPLWMRTMAGNQDLRKQLKDLVEGEASEEGTFWLTVVDAEAATAGLLAALVEVENHSFITVLKGAILNSLRFVKKGKWKSYRDRDRVREVLVVVHGTGAPEEGLALRGVEMQRLGTRNPHRTLYVTDAAKDFLSTREVPDAYLSRWPYQEGKFRSARRGAGLERSHGYTGEYVIHVALEEKKGVARRRVERTEKRLEAARARLAKAQDRVQKVNDPDLKQVAEEKVRQRKEEVKAATDRHKAAVEEKKRQSSMPDQIFVRDTTRENVATAMTMTGMLLVEWVLREYFGGAKMELHTFLNYFLYLPVEVRTSWHRVLHRIDARSLSPERQALLRRACEEITRRHIKRSGRWLKFEVLAEDVEQ